MAAVACAAREAGCTRLWLITTNDNLDALRFYQRRSFRIAHGIPIRDEIELERLL